MSKDDRRPTFHYQNHPARCRKDRRPSNPHRNRADYIRIIYVDNRRPPLRWRRIEGNCAYNSGVVSGMIGYVPSIMIDTLQMLLKGPGIQQREELQVRSTQALYATIVRDHQIKVLNDYWDKYLRVALQLQYTEWKQWSQPTALINETDESIRDYN